MAAARTLPAEPAPLRRLVIVLGDQLDVDAAAFDDFDPAQDAVWMAEVAEESTHVWSTQPRIAMFLAAMRHHAEAQRAAGRTLHYTTLDDPANRGTLAAELRAAVERLRPQRLAMTAPGDWRVFQSLKQVAADAGVDLDIHEDRHFYSTVREFAAHARGRKSLRLEYWYRELRERHEVLMEPDPARAGRLQPAGGQWNYDADNRESFGSDGPGPIPARPATRPDAITREVVALVRRRFADHPGTLEHFDWPVTRAQALDHLARFVRDRLPGFGRWQDAIWEGEPWLWHSQLAAAMNLKLLHPREAVDAAEQAWHDSAVPLAAAEGFIRQILGWREYVRGLYWTRMPDYASVNALEARADLPGWFWTGEVEMACLRDAVGQTLKHGYAHHIQRLMVTGLYALLLGVEPRQVHEWYLAVYVDAVEWVELPNVLGMSQYADGGLMASKPYVATGQYLKRMSNHCRGCRYDPAKRVGDDACPYTTLYWDFLMRHEDRLARNPRMVMQVRNLARLGDDERRAIRLQAERWR